MGSRCDAEGLTREDLVWEFVELFDELSVDHVNEIWPSRTPYFKKMMMNGFAAEQAWERGLIPNDLPFAEARDRSLISDRVRAVGDASDFSRRIREG